MELVIEIVKLLAALAGLASALAGAMSEARDGDRPENRKGRRR